MQADVDRGKSSEGDDPVQTHSCSKCGREFVGNYCLECGQATSRELSTTEVISESVREFIDVEREFWKTPKALMIRPGTALQAYLSGARGCPISPGRYLLVAVVICYGVDQALTWIGGRASLSDQASGRVSEGTSALIREVRVAAWRVFGSQGARIAVNLLLVGLRSLVLWRLFRTKLDRGAEVLTLGGFLIGHAVLPEAAAKVVYAPLVYLGTGRRPNTRICCIRASALRMSDGSRTGVGVLGRTGKVPGEVCWGWDERL